MNLSFWPYTTLLQFVMGGIAADVSFSYKAGTTLTIGACMLKSFFILGLVLSLLSSSFAQASSTKDLSHLIDMFHYNLTVEWDQKDQAQFDFYTEEFKTELSHLRGQGLTNEEIVSYIKENFVSGSKVKEFEELLKISSLETSQMLQENLKHLFNKGSRWQWDLGVDGPYIFWGSIIGAGIMILLATTAEERHKDKL